MASDLSGGKIISPDYFRSSIPLNSEKYYGLQHFLASKFVSGNEHLVIPDEAETLSYWYFESGTRWFPNTGRYKYLDNSLQCQATSPHTDGNPEAWLDEGWHTCGCHIEPYP